MMHRSLPARTSLDHPESGAAGDVVRCCRICTPVRRTEGPDSFRAPAYVTRLLRQGLGAERPSPCRLGGGHEDASGRLGTTEGGLTGGLHRHHSKSVLIVSPAPMVSIGDTQENEDGLCLTLGLSPCDYAGDWGMPCDVESLLEVVPLSVEF